MKIQINKFKYEHKTGAVTVEYEQLFEGTDDIKITLKSNDKPLSELIEKLDSLSRQVEIICDLPNGYCNHAEIRGVSFSHTNGVLGAVITALIPLTNANSPMVINTPHLPSEQYSEGGQSPLLPQKATYALKEILGLVEKYINGEREKEETNQMEIELIGVNQ